MKGSTCIYGFSKKFTKARFRLPLMKRYDHGKKKDVPRSLPLTVLQGTIVDVLGNVKELYGYASTDIIGRPISDLIPALQKQQQSGHVDVGAVGQYRFFGSRAQSGSFFPVMVHLQNEHLLKITSLPSIAGMIIVRRDGSIQSMSSVPAKYLFGYPRTAYLENTLNVHTLLPQFSAILQGLEGRWQEGDIIGSHACRLALLEHPDAPLPTLTAVHRDGSRFEVQLQLQSIGSIEETLVSVWVTFDRIHALSEPKYRDTLSERTPAIPSALPSAATASGFQAPPQTIKESEEEQEPDPPARSPELSAADAEGQHQAWALPPPLPCDTHHPLESYVIVDTLGEGAYGTAKLAYRRDDPAKVRNQKKTFFFLRLSVFVFRPVA